VLENRADGDDSVRPRHLELEVGVVQDGHELRIAWQPKHGVVSAMESYYLECEGLLPEVRGIPKSDGQVDLPEG
jgi:hypothetical protein